MPGIASRMKAALQEMTLATVPLTTKPTAVPATSPPRM
jgi:hypothetical protein